MDPKYKTLIPLIIIIIGVVAFVIGYEVRQPVTIIAPTPTPTSTPIPTLSPTPIPTLAPTQSPTPTPTSTPILVSDFIVKDNYDPNTDIPCMGCIITIEGYNNVNPSGLSIRPGQSVVIKVTSQSLPKAINLTLYDTANCSPCLPPAQKYLGAQNGGVFITFNNKGTYMFNTVIPSGDPYILPTPFTTNNTITVY